MSENDEKNREIDTTGSLVEGSSPQLNDEEWAEKLRNNGRRFGYPQCCIDFFVLGVAWAEKVDDGQFVWMRYLKSVLPLGLSYVPCPACARRLSTLAPSSPQETPETPTEVPSTSISEEPKDAVAAFVEDAFRKSRGAFTSTAEIMAAARTWCAEHDVLPFGPRALAAVLRRRRGVQAHSNGQRRGWRGVRLR